MKKTLLLALACIGLAGCPPNKPAEKSSPPPVSAVTVMPGLEPSGPPTGDAGGPPPATGSRKSSPLDARPDVPVVVNLSIYHIAVPVRSISDNQAFWKHVDENHIDVDVKDLMQLNGFRIGLAPQADWDYFKEIFNKQSLVSQKTGGTAVNTPTVVEMPFRQNIDREWISWFDPSYQLAGQTYDRCDNWMIIRFEPLRRSPGTVRVRLTPMVRSQRVEIRYTALEAPIETPMVHPDYRWNLLSQVDIPLDHFLVVAPTPDRTDGPTLGHNFLIADGNGEQSEHLLLISPQPFQIDTGPGPATRPAAGK